MKCHDRRSPGNVENPAYGEYHDRRNNEKKGRHSDDPGHTGPLIYRLSAGLNALVGP